MSLLSIKHATKRYRRGRLERVAIRDVSFEIEPGELVAVWGARRSGRSTLLRLAAGIESPDEGTVSFEGRDLAACRDRLLGRRIGYCQLPSRERSLVVDHVAAGLLAQRASPRQARRHAEEMLARVGAQACARLECHELDGAEVARVGIASALVTAPAMLVIDEPTNGVDLLERDPLLVLLRAIANEGVAVLMSTGDAQGLSGVDRALSIDNGELRGELTPTDATVVPLRRVVPSADAVDSGSR
ncbi:MAG TPA: ATP-binding cassette domain-containing protein [Solirubrobacteraceae bacterium]|nr:ATP-binding cassette domain-containing protein [Solirubrobacteraceae bacterium]